MRYTAEIALGTNIGFVATDLHAKYCRNHILRSGIANHVRSNVVGPTLISDDHMSFITFQMRCVHVIVLQITLGLELLSFIDP